MPASSHPALTAPLYSFHSSIASKASVAAAQPTGSKLSSPYAFAAAGVIAEGSSGRALINAQTNTITNTPQSCATYCTSLGYPLSGTEYSAEW